jgi:hypothetical protein
MTKDPLEVLKRILDPSLYLPLKDKKLELNTEPNPIPTPRPNRFYSALGPTGPRRHINGSHPSVPSPLSTLISCFRFSRPPSRAVNNEEICGPITHVHGTPQHWAQKKKKERKLIKHFIKRKIKFLSMIFFWAILI